MCSLRILVVEDEPRLNELVSKKLKTKGHSVDFQLCGDDALSYIRCTEYDAIVVDIMLTGMNGLDILNEMRRGRNNTPVPLLTARDSIEDRVKGLNTGADDYLIKTLFI